MSIHNFPSTPFPEGVDCQQQTGCSIDIVDLSWECGRCEMCHKELSTVIFNVGITLHHLCKSCFEKMMRTFAPKSNSVFVKNVESKQKVSGHFEFN